MKMPPLQNLAFILLSFIPLYLVYVFIYSYALPVPFADQWEGSLPIALALQRGEFPAQQIWQPVNGHRHVFMHLLTVTSTLLDDWNPKAEAYFTPFLVLCNWALILRIFHRQAPQMTLYYAPLLSSILFSLYPNDLWLFSWNSAWQFVFLFFLLCFSVVYFRPIAPSTFGLALFFALLTTFSFGTGLLVWLLMPPVFWVRGYRHIGVYGLWGLVGAGAIWLYFSGGASESQFAGLTLANLPQIILFALRMLGSALSVSGYELTWAGMAGFLGLFLVAANLWALWQRKRRFLLPWLVLLGYALGMVAMITLTRFDPQNPEVAVAGRYAYSSLVFWLVAAALILLNGFSANRLSWLNLFLGMVFLGAHLQANLASVSFMAQQANRPFVYAQEAPSAAETCIRRFLRRQDASCLADFPLKGGGEPEEVYQLAAYRLTVFAAEKPRQLLPNTYQVGDPVIIQSPSIWLNLFVRDTLLNFFPEEHLYHVTAANSLRAVYADVGDIHFASPPPRIWLVSVEAPADYFSGYYPTPVLILDADYRQSPFRITRYDLPPDDLSLKYEFGEGLELRAFHLDSYQLAPCQGLRLQTWWQIRRPFEGTYASTAILSQGETFYQSDGELANIPFVFWELNRPYVDERWIELPCDAPAGAYDVLLGVYQLGEGFQNLSLGPNGGTRAYLTTLTRRD